METMIEPRNDLVLVEPDAATVRNGALFARTSIIIPDSAREESRTGRVIAIGKKVFDVKQDDLVLFPRYAGVSFKRGEDRSEWEGLRLMREEELLAKITVSGSVT